MVMARNVNFFINFQPISPHAWAFVADENKNKHTFKSRKTNYKMVRF